MIEQWLYYVVGPIAGGLIAASTLVLAKAPNADRVINRLLPYKAFIGIGLLALAVLNSIQNLPHIGAAFSHSVFFAVTLLLIIGTGFLIGALFGLPQIAKWAAGRGMGGRAEERAALVTEKLMPFEVPIGVIAIVAGVCAAVHLVRIG